MGFQLIAEGRRKKEEGRRKKEVQQRIRSTDVTDVRKKEEAVIPMVSAIKNVLTVLAVAKLLCI